ncbi:MAG TPA: hypothetical protein VGN09_23690 [Vicinamibacteria bacterium]
MSGVDDADAAARADEKGRLRQLRMVVDLTCNVLMQGRLPRDEAEELVAAARRRALELFPDKEETYELILAPRFARLVREFAAPKKAAVTPFRTRF